MLNLYSVKAFAKSPYIKFLIFTLIKLFGLLLIASFVSLFYFSESGKEGVQKLFPPNFLYCFLSILVLFTKFNKKNIQYYNQYKNNFAMHLNFLFNLLTSTWFVLYVTVFAIFCIINKYSVTNIVVFFAFNFLFIFLMNIFQKQSSLFMFFAIIFIGINTFINQNPFNFYIEHLSIFAAISGLLFIIAILNLHKVRYVNYSEKQIIFEAIRGKNTKLQNYLLFEFINLTRNKKNYLIQSCVFFVAIMIFLVLMHAFSPEKFFSIENSWYVSIFYAALLNLFNILYGTNIFIWNKDYFIEIKSKNFSMKDYITSKYLLLSIVLSMFFIISVIIFSIFNLPLPRLIFIYLVDLFFIPLYAVVFSMILLKPMEDSVRQMILGLGLYTILIPAILPYEILTKFIEIQTINDVFLFALPICAIPLFLYQKLINSFEISIANKIRNNIFRENQVIDRKL